MKKAKSEKPSLNKKKEEIKRIERESFEYEDHE